MKAEDVKKRGQEISARMAEIEDHDPQTWDEFIGALDAVSGLMADMRKLAVEAKAAGVSMAEALQ